MNPKIIRTNLLQSLHPNWINSIFTWRKISKLFNSYSQTECIRGSSEAKFWTFLMRASKSNESGLHTDESINLFQSVNLTRINPASSRQAFQSFSGRSFGLNQFRTNQNYSEICIQTNPNSFESTGKNFKSFFYANRLKIYPIWSELIRDNPRVWVRMYPYRFFDDDDSEVGFI